MKKSLTFLLISGGIVLCFVFAHQLGSAMGCDDPATAPSRMGCVKWMMLSIH